MDTNNNNNNDVFITAKRNAGFGLHDLEKIYNNATSKEAESRRREKTLEGVRDIFKEHDERQKKFNDEMLKLNELAKNKREENEEKELERRKATAVAEIEEEEAKKKRIENAYKDILKDWKKWGKLP